MTTGNTPTSIEELHPKMKFEGIVKKIELYGALVDIGVGRNGLLHISQISNEHVKNVSDKLQEGQTIEVWVQEVDRKKGRISLTMIEPAALGWNEIAVNNVYTGKVVRMEKFGVFVDIGAERPGLVHVSELAKGYVGDPSEVVKVDEELEVKVIDVNRRKKQIDLSVRALEQPDKVEAVEEDESLPTAMELALRQAMGDAGMPMPSRGSDKKRNNRKQKRHQEREDIFLRTLQQHSRD